MGQAIHITKKHNLSCCHWLLAVVLLLVFPSLHGCRSKPKEVRILFTGDILLSRNVIAEIENNGSSPWKNMDSLFSSADLVIGNLEGAVGEAKDSMLSSSGSPVFDIRESFIPILSKAGFKALSIENNHSEDLGDSGKLATLQALYKENILPVSFYNSPQFLKIGNVNVSIIALNLVPDRGNRFQEIPSIEIKQKLRVAKNLSNLVVIYIHWGSELLDWPNQSQRDAADWLTKNGADLIIGSHPHVIQQPELVNGKPVFFSLGNHLFDQKYAATKEGLIVDCRIRDGEFICEGIITHTTKNSFYPEVTGSKKYEFPSSELNNSVMVSGISLQGETNEFGQGKTTVRGNVDEKTIFQTQPMGIVSLETGKLDGNNEYLITLERHYSNMDGEIGIRPYVYSITKNGLIARWRGSALAWPLLDAIILPGDSKILCALHRGDSFIQLNKNSGKLRVAAYEWNGFGFTGVNDKKTCQACEEHYKIEAKQLRLEKDTLE